MHKRRRISLSRKQAATRGILAGDAITQANSITSPWLKHFFDCSETGVSIPYITDVKGGLRFNANATDFSDGADVGKNVRLTGWSGETLTGSWVAPGAKDWIVMACARARGDSSNPDWTANTGAISFYVGNDGDTNGQIKVHPYYAVFIVAGKQIATPFLESLKTRIDGKIYSIAASKKGNILTHYVFYDNNIIINSIDITRVLLSSDPTVQNILTIWNNFNPSANMYASHSAYADLRVCYQNNLTKPDGIVCSYESEIVKQLYVRSDGGIELSGSWSAIPGNSGAITNDAQDYFGFLTGSFEKGLPDDTSEAISWMKNDWTNIPKGEKRVYPNWLSLI